MIFKSLLNFFQTKKNRATSALNEDNEERNEFDPLKEPIAIHSKYDSVEFLNKYCRYIDDFVINDEINQYDLQKLADLNRITIDINGGWYPLVIELIKELNENGWNKQVSCIKQKYASLRFYIDEPLDEIIEKYEERSGHICEICGEKGKIRYSGWEEVLCRKHYTETFQHIKPDESGFTFNGTAYSWNDVVDIHMDNFDYWGKYGYVKLTFKENILPKNGLVENELTIHNSVKGYGKFLQLLPLEYKPANFRFRDYIKDRFSQVQFCEICGYEAVYDNECECCEELTSTGQLNRDPEYALPAEKYIKICQKNWFLDDGEIYESQQQNYPKNPKHKILFTEEELKERKEL